MELCCASCFGFLPVPSVQQLPKAQYLSAPKKDLEKTLELEPKHFGAPSGLFHVCFQQGEQDKAMEYLQKVALIHPLTQERFSFPKAMWLERYRLIHSLGHGI